MVHHPSLARHRQHDLAKRQMRHFGTILSFEVRGGRDAARRVLDALSLARAATSFGGPETLVCHPATSTHVGLAPEAMAAAGVTESMLRVSVGLEHPEDIWDDLDRALSVLRG
jgi:cystathionine beta-lyase/cystathionine gamma-synthase